MKSKPARTQMLEFFCAAAFAVTVPVAAWAAPAGFCQEYASHAVIAATQNMSHACGFMGERWGLDYQPHYDQCLRMPQAAAARERAIRQKGMRDCRGGTGTHGA